jgi:hypothetical protein
MDPFCTGTSGLQQAQSWGADCGSSATTTPCLPSGNGDGWARRASIRHSWCWAGLDRNRGWRRVPLRARGVNGQLEGGRPREPPTALGAVQAAGGQSQRASTSSHAPCGRPKPCGSRLSNGGREHEHQLCVSLGLSGQVARRAGGLAPRCFTAAVVTAAADWRRRVKVQVELQRAIHPDEGGSGVGE